MPASFLVAGMARSYKPQLFFMMMNRRMPIYSAHTLQFNA